MIRTSTGNNTTGSSVGISSESDMVVYLFRHVGFQFLHVLENVSNHKKYAFFYGSSMKFIHEVLCIGLLSPCFLLCAVLQGSIYLRKLT